MPELKQDLQIEVILPVTGEELQAIYGHQIGMLLITLMPILDLHFGLGSLPEASRFGRYLYFGLYLERLFQQKTYFPQVVFNYLYNNLAPEGPYPKWQGFYEKSSLSTDITAHSDSLSRPLDTSLYIKTVADRGAFFSEADQMIDYVNQLFRPEQNYQETIYSRDYQAFMTPPLQSGEYEVYQLSVTNPDNATHSYDIAYKDGCHRLLGRDGMSLDKRLAASWVQGPNTALSLSPVNSPAPASRRKLSIHIPREVLGMGLSQASSLLSESMQSAMLSSFYSMLAKVVISTELSSGGDGFGYFPEMIAGHFNSEQALARRGEVQRELFPPAVALMKLPGIIQLMEKEQDDSFKFGGSSSAGSASHQLYSEQKGKRRGKGDSPDENNEDDEEREGAPGSTSSLSSSGNGLSLIEFVARDRLTYFSTRTSSQYPKRVDMHFIKLLSRAGLAQVIVGEDPESADQPLAISKTLLRYLTSYKEAAGLPDRRDQLRGMQEGDSYYVELNQELYDVMLERYEAIQHLAENRSDVFTAYRQKLLKLIYSLNQFHPGHRFVFIGGEAISAQIGMLSNKGHFLRGNFPIRDDIDILMRMGNMEMFRRVFTFVNSYPVIHPKAHSMSFPFPCMHGMCLFNVYKVRLQSDWSDFLPTLDISFPDDERTPAYFGDNLSVMIESMNRALQFKENNQKYRDRTLFLRSLLPGYLGAEFLYQREFHLPSLIRDKMQLLEEATLSEDQRKELEARIETQQKEMEARFQEMEDLKKTSRKQLKQLRLELEMEMSTQLEVRMNELIFKSKKQTEEYSNKLFQLQENEKDLTSQFEARKKQVLELTKHLEVSNLELQRVKSELKELQKRPPELEALLENGGKKSTADASVQVEDEKPLVLENQRAELQKELDSLKESNRRRNTKITQLKSILQTAKQKYDEQKETIKQLTQEQESRKEEYDQIKQQLKESTFRIEFLERELEEARKQQEWLKVREAEYETNKKEINIEFDQMTNRLGQAEGENGRLREEARRYRKGRNMWVAIGMIPTALFAMREFLVPRFHDAAKASCSRFKHDIIYQYCVRNWVTEEAVLWALEAFDQLPEYTRVVRFAEAENFKPGYNLAYQKKINKFELHNYLFQTAEINLHLPDDFMALENLHISELDQSLDAFVAALDNRSSPAQVKRFATSNLLLCGIMPDKKRQKVCAEALAVAMAPEERWPCNMHNMVNPKDNICERLLMPGFTRKLAKKKLLGLVPVWRAKPDGKFKWYDTWPVQMNKYRLTKELPGGNCSQFMALSKYCDGKTITVWQFTDNHWDLTSHYCHAVSVADIGRPKAFWFQSWTGKINDVLACDGMKFMQTVWQR